MTATSTAPPLTARPHPGRRWLTTVGLLLMGPLLFDLGYALHPSLPDDAAAALVEVGSVREMVVVSKVMVAVGGLILIALLLALRRRLVPERGRRLATVGAVLATVGLAFNALSQATFGYLLFYASDPTIDPAAGTAILEVALGTTDLVTLPVSFLSIPLFALGLLLFAAALWRAGTVPRWVPVVIVVAGIGAAAIGTGPGMGVVLILDLAAYGAAAMAAARHPVLVPARQGDPVVAP